MEEARSRVARGEELSTKEMVQVHQLVLGAARLDGGNHCFQGGGSWLVRRGEGEEEGREKGGSSAPCRAKRHMLYPPSSLPPADVGLPLASWRPSGDVR